MAKLTANGVTIEGTAEELAILMAQMTAKADVVESVVPTFKEGDKVRVNAKGEFGGVEVGEIGTVEEGFADEDDEYSVRVDNADDHDYFRPQDLELVTEKAVEPASLKVGDYAVVIKQGINGARVFTPGQVVKVTFEKDTFDNILRPMVKSVDGREEWYMTTGEEIRKATEEEVVTAKAQAEADAIKRKKDAIFTDAGREPNEYREGDIIRYKGDIDDGIYAVSHTDRDEVHFFCGKFDNTTEYMHLEDIVPLVFVENRLDRN